MAGARGYRSYRGRGSKGKIVLAVILVLVIVASLAFIRMQEYVVYDESGRPRLSLPGDDEPQTPPEEEEDVNLVIQEKTPETVRAMQLSTAPLTGWDGTVLTGGTYTDRSCDAVAVTMKDAAGLVYFDAAGAVSGAVRTEAGTAAALEALNGSDTHTIAILSCFHDPLAANADVEGMGLKNTGGYIFYDGNNGNWLDPSKPAARQYLCTLAAELAQQGVDEILLTDVGYPTVGKLDKIDYNGADRAASIRLFLEELRSALGEYGVAVSIELPPEVITSGADDTAGLVLSDIAPLVDRVYAVTTVDQIPALEAAVSAAGEDTDFVAELTGHSPDVTGSCLILAD